MLEYLYTTVIDGHRRAFPVGAEVHIARAPGRVNIIGEHTDYNGLPVLPTAIDREIAFAFAVSESPEVVLTNADGRYGDRSFAISERIEPFAAGDWGNYAKAAAQALWNWASEHSPATLPLRGVRACVGGNIPAASGLSSSSAMVVASAFAIVHANNLHIGRAELAALLARAERYVGTEGGGMDQAASILSEPGCVLRIDFDPLRTQPVPVPDKCVFVICNSMVHADKAGGARLAYNTRVAECRIGVQMLKTVARGRYPSVDDAVLLGDVMRIVPEWPSLLGELPVGGVSVSEAARFCDMSEGELRERCLKLRDGSLLDEPASGFQVAKRCRHVLTEARRVDLAADAIRANRLDDLGRHMDDSHESCAVDYEVSCEELDELVRLMRHHGALGARLTGAGFGGCAVGVILAPGAEALLEGVLRDYYGGYLADRGIGPVDDTSSVAFKCVVSAGAGVIVPS
jgi:N-acetylgalactosamine kinase